MQGSVVILRCNGEHYGTITVDHPMSLQYITAHPRVTLHQVCLGRSTVCLISRFFSIFSMYPSFCLSLLLCAWECVSGSEYVCL